MIYKDLIINQNIFLMLSNTIAQNRLPHAIIFYGKEGIGKEAHAIEFSALLNCKNIINKRACGNCSHCIRIKTFQHANVKIITPMPPSKKSINIDGSSIHSLSSVQLKNYQNALQKKGKNPYYKISLRAQTIPISVIRKLRKEIYMSSIEDGWRIIMIFEADKLCIGTQASANALLKILEEPPEKTMFILVTSQQDRLLDTIKSRSQSFYFSKPDDKKIEEFLIKEGINKKESRILSKICEGNISLAINLNTYSENIPIDIKIIIEAFFNKNAFSIQKFQNRLEELNRGGNNYLFDNFFQLQVQLIRDIILLKHDPISNRIIFKNLEEEYFKIINKNLKADFNSMLDAVDDALRMNSGNVNLSLNALNLIFDIHSCLAGKEYQLIS